MSRQQRFNLVNIPQHVLQRGNNGGDCFFDDGDRRFYLACLYDAAEQYECEVHAYTLMPYRVHLLVTPKRPLAVSRCMQSIGRRYVQYINHKYHRSGTLWEGRYHACLVDSGRYFLTCSRFIEFCALRAGMVERAEAYRWSSYRANALGERDHLITSHAAYRALAPNAGQRASLYRKFCSSEIGEALLSELKQAMRKETVFGRKLFKEELEAMLNRKIQPRRRGRPPRKSTEIRAGDGLKVDV